MNTPNEKSNLFELLKLLHDTFTGKDTKKISESKDKIKSFFANVKSGISMLFQALSLTELNNKQIPVDLHKSVAVYLKNIFTSKIKLFQAEDLFLYLKKIFDIIFNTQDLSSNINNPSIFNILQNVTSTILSSEQMSNNDNYLVQIFETLINITKADPSKNPNFLKNIDNVILFCSSLLGTKCANQNNYKNLINNYYIPIINQVFRLVPNYIIPKDNIYNKEFIIILKDLFDGFYGNLTKMRGILPNEEKKEISLKFFREYGEYGLDLLSLVIPFNEENKKKFGRENPIITFNVNVKECENMNFMKGKILQFLSYITQISTLDEKYAEENKNLITDKDLIELINKLIILIMNTFRDILGNEEKYNLVKRYSGELSEEDDCYNLLLFQICVFLSRSLVREPIKSEFANHIRKFLLNILFPLIVTIDDEINFLEVEAEEYSLYINDITSDFKMKKFRTSACFLVNKICERYDEMNNFVLSFCIEMLNYIINEGKINSKMSEFNLYLKFKDDALINKINDVQKLDFTLLIILILKDRILKNIFFKNRLREIFIQNQDKIHTIVNPMIKVKLCRIYDYFLQRFFRDDSDINEDIKKNFIRKAINFLLINIIQNGREKEYLQNLANEASDTIIDILNVPIRKDEKNAKFLNEYISKSLEENFALIIQLIDNVDANSFYLVIEQIISNIQIEQRNLVFDCLSNLTKKFQTLFLKQTSENKFFFTEYFTIIRNFLSGKNGINPENKDEINKFNQIFDQILNYIKNPKKFSLYEDIVMISNDYIKLLNLIDERSLLVLNSIKMIIDVEKCFSIIEYNYVKRFLDKIFFGGKLDKIEFVKEIITIIDKCFNLPNEYGLNEPSKIFAMLLNMQILINMNTILPPENYSYLISQSYKAYHFISNERIDILDRDTINQLALANISIGFIFKPDLTFQILNQTEIPKDNEKITSPFTKYIYLLHSLHNIDYPNYYPSLSKCVILGICSIFFDQTCWNYLNQNKELKLFLIRIFIHLIVKHKKEKNIILSKMMKKELKCNFVEDENEEEEEEEDEDEDLENDYSDKIEDILKKNDNINSSDEFQYFTRVMKYIKENSNDIYTDIIEKSFDGKPEILEDMFKIRNIKIMYKEKEFTVPRKTVKIIRTLN